MTVTARYRPGATRTPFVDREEALALYDQLLDRPGEPRLLTLTGVGGIGKSRLLHELRRRAMAASGPLPTAVINLQEPAQRSQIAALASIRTQFAQSGARFDRFDIAYAVWWQRLNPQVALTRDRLPFAKGSEVVATVFNEVTDVPIFGSAVRVTELLSRRLRRWRTIRHDPTLQELDTLPPERLGDAVTYLLAQEINQQPDYLLCVDAYEALVGGEPHRGRSRFVDAWLRDLVWQLDRGLVAFASRESLGWEQHEPQWGARLHEYEVRELPFDNRLELLAALGAATGEEAEAIARECAGLPYYLHLAHEAGSTQGTFAQIEERFLYHVEPDMVRLLELLSVARTFDQEIFVQLAAHFGMRSDAITWETLISYSFVSSAGAATLQLHQLMAQAICARLSPAVEQELNAVLHQAWRDRVLAAPTFEACREAAYHAARLADPPQPALLAYADQAAALAGKPGLDALLADLPDRPRLRMLWEAESALLIGDATTARATTETVPTELPGDADEIDARLAMAAANAHRILGATIEALTRYGAVWHRYAGPVSLGAGTWYADLQMAQGRFRTALATVDQLTERCPPDNEALLGDLARLRFLTHRFSFDTTSAADALGKAREHYQRTGHVVGLANTATNTVELLALTDPAAAKAAAPEALAAQRRLGADHELGKTHTALALAQITLGELTAAAASLDEAVITLDRCGYRSGRARAELVRALWHARAGQPDAARDSVRWAVAECEAVDVYPTLVMLAAVLLDRIGRRDPAVTVAAERAAAAAEPLPGLDALRGEIRDLVRRVVDDRWDEVYRAASAVGEGLSGFYHHNVRVGGYLVRAPLPAAERMDLHIWPEPSVLAAIRPHLATVPVLRAVSDDPPYQIHDWIDGDVLDAIAPRGVRVPSGVIDQCAVFFEQLGAVPIAELPPLPSDWPADDDCAGFAHRLLAVTRDVHDRFAQRYAPLWRALEIPPDPFAPLRVGELRPRPFRLLHCDVHRKNIILTSDGGCRFLDWELALFGDPVYELAVHLHKMAYQPDEETALIAAWATKVGADDWPRWRDDLASYRGHEWVKSAIVDSVRYTQVVAADPAEREPRIASLTGKLTAARRVWGRPTPAEPEQVAAAIETFLRQ